MRIALALVALLALSAHRWTAADGTEHVADWIMRGGYKGPNGASCCGPRDCFKIDPDSVKFNPGSGNYIVRYGGVTFAVPEADAKISEVPEPYVCMSTASTPGLYAPLERGVTRPTLRCLFVTPLGA